MVLLATFASKAVLAALLHHSVFSGFSSAEFIDSRIENPVERLGLYLSFACLFLFWSTTPPIDDRVTKTPLSPQHWAAVYVFVVIGIALKINHFISPFMASTTPSFHGFNYFDPNLNPQHQGMRVFMASMLLGVSSLAIALGLAQLVYLLKRTLTRAFNRGRGQG